MVKFYAKKKPGMKRAKSGKYYYPKKRRVGRRPVKQVRRIARQQVMNMIPTKKHLIGQNLVGAWGAGPGDDGHGLDPDSNVNWVVFKPLALDFSTKSDDDNTRTEERIFAKNYLLNGELMMPKELKGCVQVRTIMGWYKGTQTVATGSFQAAVLHAAYPEATSRPDPQLNSNKAFKIISDTMRTYHPLQIYDDSSGESVREASGLGSDNVALWKPIVVKRNFKINRKISYDNADGDSQVGWCPFIAIGIFPCENANIGVNNDEFFARGQHPTGPTFGYESRMYFKDIVN